MFIDNRVQRQSFVLTKEISFENVEYAVKEMLENSDYSIQWIIFGFKEQNVCERDSLCVIATGANDLSDQSNWPQVLFSPNTICYGLCKLTEDDGISFTVSFCWKGQNLPVSLRTKYTEFNGKIQDFLHATAHFDLKHPDDLSLDSMMKILPPRRRRTSKRGILSKEIKFDAAVEKARDDVCSDDTPFNWVVCGYANENSTELVLMDVGMTGLYALKGIGGIVTALKPGKTMYIYLRVDVPMIHQSDGSVSKYVLVTWQGSKSAHHVHDMDQERNSREMDHFGAAAAYGHTSEIYQFFPHHVHFFASVLSELSEESVRERVRLAIDSDALVLRVVCIQPSGDYQSPICVEVSRDGTVKDLRDSIASTIGIPEEAQRLVWIHTQEGIETSFASGSTAVLLDNPNSKLLSDIGLTHGDKLHVDDNTHEGQSYLAKLVEGVNTGIQKISLSAERRHEVQRVVEAREAELKSSLSAVHELIRKRIQSSRHQRILRERETEESGEQLKSSREVRLNKDLNSPNSTYACLEKSESERDVHELEERVRVLEEHNKYLEIPYESIRILEGKENQLGIGKAATVYRGLWMSGNGSAEVAIKVFRYARLTDSILKNYRDEVGMLRKLKHPNIVLFIGACTNPKLMILTEYCSRGSLHSILHDPDIVSKIPWKFKVRMMLDAARGIQYLHSKKIIHRDIKSHNLLVDDDWRIKVADFGISKVLDNNTQAFTQCGTTGWVAPEVLADEEEGYTSKADNWSFAIVMWEMIAGDNTNPFIGMAPVKFYRQTIQCNKRPIIDNNVDPVYNQLIRSCWSSEPNERPSFQQVVSKLEEILLNLRMDISLPPAFQSGYHSLS